MWYPVSGVILDCIDSRSLPPLLLSIAALEEMLRFIKTIAAENLILFKSPLYITSQVTRLKFALS